MKSKRPPLTIKSFKELREILDREPHLFRYKNKTNIKYQKDQQDPKADEEIFRKAMEGVKPINGEKRIEGFRRITSPPEFKERDEAEALKMLEDLVNYGKGFNVEDTPEYIEGTGYNVHPDIAKRLHRGDFSIQTYIDLHGLDVNEAKEVFDEFMKWAVKNGKTGILIIHGRGLSSPSEPILKNKVIEWLTHAQWRKWVIAYSSARRCDGGAGATYVLLRRRPVSKRMKIRKGKNL